MLAAQGFAGDAAVGEVEDKRIGPIGCIGPITRRRELLVRPTRRTRINRRNWWRRFVGFGFASCCEAWLCPAVCER